ncbi:amino acid ABC transporter permease [Terribacillus saccharophilus]|uniref:amino acid ABC transporter permease n=1 Tax=Terribacillus saccharophilus TaxID=361277 RepID=UPI002989CE76|nr:amino acid ABC transporter permease [Terribacillus saccharophilus]MCM3226215.1 amino acid ABC transporter permease [Terribacillus saccharophilus]MEC0282915.1 amino acid ABC transporter permease [Terribacillus saccharophilus]MEC0292116.1 amino acid ABC transporter permease [Terribacillus saccharophilus]MEC0304189.1 amino acid ABC transporter permease [Terribacillus saccharophilus]
MIPFELVDIGKFFDAELAWENLPFILEGLPMTIAVAFAGMAMGLILGFFLAIGRSSRFFLLRWPARFYISFMRGTPILVFLFILYQGLPVVQIRLDAFTCAVLAFGLNSAAYIAEVNRGALNSIAYGQWESSYALGLNYWQTLTRVIVPQAARVAMPPLTNVFLDLVKATSLAAVITVPEMFQKAQIVAGRTFDSMTMYITVALVYWPLCIIISYFQERLEKRFSRYIN